MSIKVIRKPLQKIPTNKAFANSNEKNVKSMEEDLLSRDAC